MAVWLIRAGQHGEFEQKFLQDSRVYVTWEKLARDLSKLAGRDALAATLSELYPDSKPKRITNWVSQIWPFVHEMEKGDLVVLPLKAQRAISIGEVTGGYHFQPDGPEPYYHWRPVKWLAEAIPRSHFGKDLLFTFGAFMTICRVHRNNAEARIAAMRASGWKPEAGGALAEPSAIATDEHQRGADLEELARDQISAQVLSRFKGHGLARLVEGILKAQGYTTYRSPEGPDGGVDILAGTGPLGFDTPRLCVQVKSQDTPIESKALNELRGAMQSVHANQGLFVSWSGFKSSVAKLVGSSFFTVRLWTQKELLEALFAHYDQLDEDLKAELPLKRIWTLAAQEED